MKTVPIGEVARFELRGEFFNIWNWHRFVAGGAGLAFTTDVASPNFGYWNGSVSAPRTVQVSARISF
jgi:hypothetical protein